MTEFIPSDSFADRVMIEVMNHHRAQVKWQLRIDKLLAALPMKIVLAGGATAIGAWNLIRVYLSLFGPMLCN